MAIGTCKFCGEEETELDPFGVCAQCNSEIEGTGNIEPEKEEESCDDTQHAKQKTLDGYEADQAHVKGTPENQERTVAILKLLGFIFSREKNGDRWRKEIGDLKIAFDFTPDNQDGRVWAKRKGEQNFIEDDEIKALPVMQLFRTLANSDDPLPPAILVGTISAKKGKGILIEIEDTFEGPKQIWYGLGAVKRNTPGSQGYNPDIADNERYIPAGFSARSATQEAKLKLPRPLVLEKFEQQLENAATHTAPEPTTMAAQVNGTKKPEPPEFVPEDVTEKEHDKTVHPNGNGYSGFDWPAEMQESAEHYRLAFQAAEKIIAKKDKEDGKNIAERYELSGLDQLQFTHEIAKDINYNTEKRFRTPKGGGY